MDVGELLVICRQYADMRVGSREALDAVVLQGESAADHNAVAMRIDARRFLALVRKFEPHDDELRVDVTRLLSHINAQAPTLGPEDF